MINWKLRFKNKAFLISFTVALLALVYQFLGAFGIVPTVSQDTAEALLMGVVNVLALLGIVIDPTTKGLADCDKSTDENSEKKQ